MADPKSPEKVVGEVEAVASPPVESPPTESSPPANVTVEQPTVPATDSTSTPAPADATSGLLPPQHWTQIDEPENDVGENDSALGDNISSTASLSSLILHYRTINGRRFHSEQGNAQYWVSNDDQSNEALDINHHVITIMSDGKLHQAPLSKDIQKAVDIGTGTGTIHSTADFADEYPNASVIGTDISPIQPSWVPPNLEFQIDDCTQEWTFEENSLDYVHIRFLVGSVIDWPALFQQAYRCLKPGGYIESYEGGPNIGSDDGSVTKTSAMGQWGEIFCEGGRRIGRSFSIVEDEEQRKGIEAAGFVDIEEKDFKVPIGTWAKDPTLKEAGQYFQAAILQDIEGTLLFIANVLGWTKEEIGLFGAHYRHEIRSKSISGFFRQKVVWARKPLE
ncbi:S-adenosyl-L-methionine-dependent methyltransferase [Dactylonectria macrodidyma]|uniref:S-adenosyl-L-methionine-dependent methyltransferase n=1 Tax=Dactylonectria macrodidyma TaxID=307937 RepID=A0A9P9DMZ8_9HYPO|nr:S-adenosyl-L-methionine-dependent methyltransferase [Dactylonectria macrodidyma]